jgi:hypothetical protein
MMGVLLLRSVARACALAWLVILSAFLTGCWSTPVDTVQPREGRAGLQLTGSIAGRQLVVSDGAPDLNVGDCDPDASGDRDVCAIGTNIDGELVVVVFENPDALSAGVSLPVADPGCGARCDHVTDVAVVDLQLGTRPRLRADGGRVEITQLTPFARYAGELRSTFASGAVAGSFDLVPRRD